MTSRDFTYVENIIQANIMAAIQGDSNKNMVYNIGAGGRTTLNKLIDMIEDAFRSSGINVEKKIEYVNFRAGDVRHSQACINKAQTRLSYQPTVNIEQGIKRVVNWYLNHAKNQESIDGKRR